MTSDRVFDLSPEQIRAMQQPNPSPMVDMATGRGEGIEVTMARHADGSFTVLSERPLDDPAILALRKLDRTAAISPVVAAHLAGGPPHVRIGMPGDDLDSLAVDCRGEPLELGPDVALEELAARTAKAGGHPSHIALPLENVDAARAAGLEVAYMPATSADLLELDAVPEPVDSAAPAVTYLPGAAPIGPTAETRPYRVAKGT